MTKELFSDFHNYMNEDQRVKDDIRNASKEIEKVSRQIFITMQAIHGDGGPNLVSECCNKSRELLLDVKQGYSKLKEIVPMEEYYRYHDSWKYVTQQLSCLISLIVYFERGQLLLIEEFAEALGVESSSKSGFHVDLEDFLLGLLQLASELVRFAINSVTNGDYNHPVQIASFIGDLASGFLLLNYKNDFLRRRYDVLKYDVKKIEEVVYDLSLRNLIPRKSKIPVDDGTSHSKMGVSEEHEEKMKESAKSPVVGAFQDNKTDD